MRRDLRKYARQTNFRIIIGFIFLLCVIGLGSIYAFYGPAAAITGLICLAWASVPVILVVCALWLIDWIAKRGNLN
jgi:hypothetical protein